MNCKTIKNSLLFLGLFLIGSFIFSSIPVAAQVTVSPGNPSHFRVSVPPAAQAGIDFSLRVEVLDVENNRVEDYDELDRTIELSTDGSGSLSKNVFSSRDFQNGQLTVSLNYSRAEEIKITVSERDNVATGRSEEILVRPGPPAQLEVNLPEEARAGELFTLAVTARDAHGNRVTRYEEMTNGIIIESTGVEKPQPQFLPASAFRNGRAFTEISYNTAETIQLRLVDEANEIEVLTDSLRVFPAGLNSFSVSTPREVRAGEPFRVAIEARDRYDNIIRDYEETGRGIDLIGSGQGQPAPAFIPPAEFEEGVVFTRVTANEAELFRLIVQDRSSAAEGESDRILVRSGLPADYAVDLPGEVRAGESFTATVTALDAYGNRVEDYDEIGEAVEVWIRTDDEPGITIEPQDFEDGRAQVGLSQRQAGRFRLGVENETREIDIQSAQILVTPARPGNIWIDLPDYARAGDDFSVIVELADAYGNRIRETGNLTGQMRVAILNHTTEQEKTVRPGGLIDGKAQLSFRHDKAETVAVFVEYDRYDIRNRSDYFQIRPGSFARAAVRSPGNVQAGSSFSVGLQLQDEFGNPLQEIPEDIAPLHLEATGSGRFLPNSVDLEQLQTPEFTVDLRYFVAESLELRVLDRRERQVGTSAPIRVRPAALEAFEVEVASSAPADEDFPVRLIARDPYHNVIKNLNTHEGEVIVVADGEADLEPGRVRFREFVNGVAEVSASYRRAENIHIHARSGEASGVSDVLEIRPGAPANFAVDMRNRVRAGIPFPATISVYDRYENRIHNLPSGFSGVRLKGGGFERISPDIISASLFEQGEANVYLIYPRSGELHVEAELLGEELEMERVERIFVSRGVDSAQIYVVSSAIPEPRLRTAGPGDLIKVEFKEAYLPTEESQYSFHDWFINRIRQRQKSYRPLPVVELAIYPRLEVEVEKTLQNNLFTLKLMRLSRKIPTLQEIQSLILREEYRKASSKLEIYLEENPDDPYATRLRYRLERIQEVISP